MHVPRLVVLATLLPVLVGCRVIPDAVDFGSGEGLGDDVSECSCDIGIADFAQASGTVATITCNKAAEGVEYLSFDIPLEQHELAPVSGLGFGGEVLGSLTGTGKMGKLGEPYQPDEAIDRIFRSVEGIEITWEALDVCDAAAGCDSKLHVPAGKLHQGSGACEDEYLSLVAKIGSDH